MNQNDDNDNALDNIKYYIGVIKPMKWIASISRFYILNDVLELSLLNHGDSNNNNTHNHDNDKVHTDEAICDVLAPILNDIDASIQQVMYMNKNGEPSNSVDTNGHHVSSNIQTKKRKNRPPLLTHSREGEEATIVHTGVQHHEYYTHQ